MTTPELLTAITADKRVPATLRHAAAELLAVKSRGRPVSYTADQSRIVNAMRKSGYSLIAIAGHVGLSERTVRRIIASNSLKRNGGTRQC